MSTAFVVACAVTVAFEVGAVAVVRRTAVTVGELVPVRRVNADQERPETPAVGSGDPVASSAPDRGVAA